MKNQFFLLLLSCFFLLGNISFAHADEFGMDEVTMAIIFNGKTGTVSHSFSLPEKYVNKDGSLTAPLQIILTQNGKQASFDIETKKLSVDLPANLSGVFNIFIRVEDYSITQSISF